MFDEISPSYDLMNHFISGGRDLIWRKRGVKYLKLLNKNYGRILDLAAGSGDLGREFLKLKPQKMFSADLSERMLAQNRVKIKSDVNLQLKADAENLPFSDNYFNLCGIAFGIRNFEHLNNCIMEIKRVLKKKGVLFIIEMFRPEQNTVFNRLFGYYFNNIIPAVGNYFSHSTYAYSYLKYSVKNFIALRSFINMAEQNGFSLLKLTKNFSDIVYSVYLQKN